MSDPPGGGLVPPLVPQGTGYPFSSAIGRFVIGRSPIGIVPDPDENPPLARTIPSYLYAEYQDDEDLQALVDAYNAEMQRYVDWFNNLDLPVYTKLTGALLDWVARGLYGLIRPVLGSGHNVTEGPYDTFGYDELTYNGYMILDKVVFAPVTDDVFKRVITWHFFKGDGKVFNVRWLKRRVMRFLTGVDGVDPGVDETYRISVSFGYAGQVNITLVTRKTAVVRGAIYDTFAYNTEPYDDLVIHVTQLNPQFEMAQTLKRAIDEGVLELPFQFTYQVVVQ